MIEAELDPASGSHRIVLRPNASLSRRQVTLMLMLLAVAMGSIAAFFASMGAWPVLPFSGLEWLLLLFCFKLVLRRSAVREVITMNDEFVRIERGRDAVERADQLARAWVSVEWVKASIPGHPSHLYLRSHGRRIEVGEFLVETERAKLAGDLHRVLVNLRSV